MNCNQRGIISATLVFFIVLGVATTETVVHFAGQAIYDNMTEAKAKTDSTWECLESAKDHKVYCFKNVEK